MQNIAFITFHLRHFNVSKLTFARNFAVLSRGFILKKSFTSFMNVKKVPLGWTFELFLKLSYIFVSEIKYISINCKIQLGM